MPEKQRRQARFGAIVVAAKDLTEWTDAESGVHFVLTDAIQVDGKTAALRCSVLAAQNGDLLPGLDNPYLFDGPVPIEVPAGTWRKVPRPDGTETETENTIEDPAGAVQRMVARVVLTAARAAGWEG